MIDNDAIFEDQIDGIDGKDFQFTSSHAAQGFLNRPRIQIELPDGVDDDLYVISENKPYAVKQLIKAIMSKFKVATESGDYLNRDAKDDHAEESMIHRFQDCLQARGTPTFNRQFIAAKAEVTVGCLIKLHTDGLPLYWAHLPSGAGEDVGLTATERFHALLDLCTDIKAIPNDWISEAGLDVVDPAVLAPRKYYSMKLSGARSNMKKKQTVENARPLRRS